MYHAIGFRDALASICAVARKGGSRTAVKQAAEELLKWEPEHCHAKAILEAIEEDEKHEWRSKEIESLLKPS